MPFKRHKKPSAESAGRVRPAIVMQKALTLPEMITALAIVAIIGAVILPQLHIVRSGWDSKEASAEVIQNGRVFTEHLSRNLSAAVKINSVSEPNAAAGHIAFEDNGGTIYRYDLMTDNHVKFGAAGAGENLAGPVSSLVFTCYDGNDFSNPITNDGDVNSIRLVKAEAVFTNPASVGRDQTFTTWAYLRTNGVNRGDGELQTQITYAEQKLNRPRYRLRDVSSWSAQYLANDVGASGGWVVALKCVTRPEIAAAVLDAKADLSIQFFDGVSWSIPTALADNLITTSERPFHIAYEQSSGDLLIVYRRGNDGLLYYRTYNGSTISGELSTPLAGAGNPTWLRLLSDRSSDEVIMLALDNKNDVTAAVWSGSAWTNTILLENDTTNSAAEGISAAYEGLSGDAIVVWTANKVNSFQYRVWDGSGWSAEADGPDFGYEQKWLKLAADPCSDEIILASSGRLSNIDRVNMTVWNGFVWAGPSEVCSDGTGDDRRCFDVSYEDDGTAALAVYGKAGGQNCFYRTWNGSAWSIEQSGPGLADYVSVVQLVPASDNRIFVTVLNQADDLESMLWDGGTLSSAQTLTGDAGGDATAESFMVAVCPGTGAMCP